MRQRGWLIGVMALAAVLMAFDAAAQPRTAPNRPSQPAPQQPPTGHQTEPVDLNEGKSPAELFKAGCAVCHQSPAGLAKGRRESELTNFLRQHYTSSVQHAGALASFLTSGGRAAPAVAGPPRQQGPVDRPPAPVGRRTPDDDRKAQEASRPADRDPAGRRKPPAAAVHTPPPAAAAAPPVPEPAPEPSTSASSPPVEEKPAPPEIPL